MSDQLSVEVIITDFEKLKEIFNTAPETKIWDTFSNSNFNFNKTLNSLLDLSNQEVVNEEVVNEIKKIKRNLNLWKH